MDGSLLRLSVSLCLLVNLASSSSQQNTSTLLLNVLVVKVNLEVATLTEVVLRCGEAYMGQDVRWKENGAWLDEAPRGNELEVLVEEWYGGNYSCHNAAGEYLNHTLLLVQEEPANKNVILSKTKEYIWCWTNSYSGAFQCSWKRTANREAATVVLFTAKRGLEDLVCAMDSDGAGVSCRAPSGCLYSEETERIRLHLYMRSHYKLEHYSRALYLREIVRPDPVPLSRSEGGVLEWVYPPTWDKPCSFFPLLFQVKVLLHTDSCDSQHQLQTQQSEATNYTMNPSHKQYLFCLRARDNLTNGPWSDWTHRNHGELPLHKL